MTVVTAVAVVEDREGVPCGVRVAFREGGAVVLTVWTDWSLVITEAPGRGLPDYFWPPEEYALRSMGLPIPADGAPVDLVCRERQPGGLYEVELRGVGFGVVVGARGGELTVSGESSDSWQAMETPYDVLAARAEETWEETLAGLPVGARVTAVVIGRQPFGAFLSFGGFPQALGLARVSRMPRGRELPRVGSTVECRVYWHDGRNHQVVVELREWVTDW
ncbi:hypothetical protein [Streptomyces carpaticus]|uniref:hypothetical protein n=1 Tax=Streptomyces carpaticus TaxID=285558 RepID=UPI0031F84D65